MPGFLGSAAANSSPAPSLTVMRWWKPCSPAHWVKRLTMSIVLPSIFQPLNSYSPMERTGPVASTRHLRSATSATGNALPLTMAATEPTPSVGSTLKMSRPMGLSRW